jgi:hypothetical protein
MTLRHYPKSSLLGTSAFLSALFLRFTNAKNVKQMIEWNRDIRHRDIHCATHPVQGKGQIKRTPNSVS